jgi:hypothetical protein
VKTSYQPFPDSDKTQLTTPEAPVVTLVVGDIKRWNAQGRTRPEIDGFYFVEIDALNAALLFDIRPEVILSPMIMDQFDAIDLAKKLATLDFKGRYRAVTEAIPNTAIVLKEIRTAVPKLDFDLYIVPTSKADA